MFNRCVNIRKRSASGIQENRAHGLTDGFVGPIGVFRAQRSRLELPGGMIQPFGGPQFLGRRHCLQHLLRFSFHHGNRLSSRFRDQYKTVSLLTERGYFGSSKRALVEEGFEAGVAGAADGQARAVGENSQAAVLAVGLDAHHAFEIHDVRAVDAHKAVRIEASFQAGDG